MLSERASENIVENIMKMFRMEWRRKPTNESETLEERKFMNQHTNLAWKDMNQTIQDVYLWALGRFHPSKKRMWNKKHTNTNTAESTRIDANNIIVEPLATFHRCHRCHRCHIYRNARAFNMQRRSQQRCKVGSVKWCENISQEVENQHTTFQRENIYFCVIWPCLLLAVAATAWKMHCLKTMSPQYISHLLAFVWLS